jgi:hypothetical protein
MTLVWRGAVHVRAGRIGTGRCRGLLGHVHFCGGLDQSEVADRLSPFPRVLAQLSTPVERAVAVNPGWDGNRWMYLRVPWRQVHKQVSKLPSFLQGFT